MNCKGTWLLRQNITSTFGAEDEDSEEDDEAQVEARRSSHSAASISGQAQVSLLPFHGISAKGWGPVEAWDYDNKAFPVRKSNALRVPYSKGHLASFNP